MSSALDKRTAIVELFKAENFKKDISKSLIVNNNVGLKNFKSL